MQYRVSNGAATNNLQATTVPTNGGAATYTVEATWQKKRAELMQDILNMVFRVESNLIKWALKELKSIQHRSWILFSTKWFRQLRCCWKFKW
jgi:hypothetical protein